MPQIHKAPAAANGRGSESFSPRHGREYHIRAAFSPEELAAAGTSIPPASDDDWKPIVPALSAPDMSIVNESRRPAPALPVEVFGPWAPWIRATADGTSSPADYSACALLAVAAAIIGNSRRVSPWEGWSEVCALWVALVGRPSAGKSAPLDGALALLRTLEVEISAPYESTLRDWQTAAEAAKVAKSEWKDELKAAVRDGQPPPTMPKAAVEPDKPARPRLAVSDTTPEALCAIMAGQPRGLLSYRDELAGWLLNFDRYSGSGERAFWLEAFGGRTFILDRVKLDAPLRIPRLTISLVGGIQPDRLASCLMAGDDDGLAARMLMTWPDPVPPTRPRGIADDDAALTALRRLLSLEMVAGHDGQLKPVTVRLCDNAASLFEGWRQGHVAASDATSGLLEGHYGKMPGLLLRLALVLEHLWWSKSPIATAPPKVVSERAVAAAAGLLNDYFAPMAQRAYGDAAIPDAERLGATLARWIVRERPEVVNARDIRRKARLPGMKEAAKVRTAVTALEEAGWLIPCPARDGQSPGRPREDWTVNPQVWGAVR